MTETALPARQPARHVSARPRRGAGRAGARPGPLPFGRRLAVLAAAIAVPAMASPVEWPADPARAAPQRLGFEVPGESFPGSAFFYLDDLPPMRNPAGQLPADVAELALPRPSAGSVSSRAPALALAGTPGDRARAQRCLTLAVYYEAANEPDAGQRAVAQVVLNRVAHPSYPDTVCGVVFQGSERASGCQFTFTCDGSLARPPASAAWQRAARVARSALAGAVYDPVGLATHYHTLAVAPYWAASLDRVGTIGAHRFYRWRGAAGRAAAFSDTYRGGEPAAAPHPRSALPAADADPLALARAYEAALAAARPAGPELAETPDRATHGGAAPLGAAIAPTAGQVREEYAHSGQWLRQP